MGKILGIGVVAAAPISIRFIYSQLTLVLANVFLQIQSPFTDRVLLQTPAALCKSDEVMNPAFTHSAFLRVVEPLQQLDGGAFTTATAAH